MATTMRDVAALAGVSIKTVSRVVNGEPHTRPEIVRRVNAAVAELGWMPNPSARNLRTGRTGTVAIAVQGLRRPYLAALVEVLVDEVARRGLDATVEPTGGDPARLRSVLAGVGRTHDGVVVIGDVPPGVGGGVPTRRRWWCSKAPGLTFRSTAWTRTWRWPRRCCRGIWW